jgi:hypothetical protein
VDLDDVMEVIGVELHVSSQRVNDGSRVSLEKLNNFLRERSRISDNPREHVTDHERLTHSGLANDEVCTSFHFEIVATTGVAYRKGHGRESAVNAIIGLTNFLRDFAPVCAGELTPADEEGLDSVRI